ncbi:DNA internalization-related competence protein ComEC/Rec2 [Muricomes intestini]|uniref:DNA internalization-related competence protein ComEC/Rec2 n=1 Tax=Muricomes intestini TaxID=1796634 RepID=UPI000E95CCCE|nr:DNA internalization-related competence protein ComEC/Rec2 [Lachnospiraceae bacterium]
MIKRPLCAASILFLSIQVILTGGLDLSPGRKPSGLEKQIDGKARVVLAGTVCRREEKTKCEALYLKNSQIYLNNQVFHESKILVFIETKNQTRIGNRIKVSGEAGVFQDARNPGNFNQKFYYGKEGIHVSVWADELQILDARVNMIFEKLARVRKQWKNLLTEHMGEYYGNIMGAILLGDKGNLDSDVKDLYQKSGIGHILAISGLHMSFLGNGLYRLLRKIGLPFKLAGTVGICFLLAYTLMTGCGVSSIRAFIMFLIRIGADITGRDYDMPTSLALSAAVIAAWQPLYLFDAGFLLSFGALTGITVVAPCLEFCFIKEKEEIKKYKSEKESRLTKYRKKQTKRYMKEFCSGLAVNITLLPLLLYFFFEFPPYSVLLNLFVIPLTSTLMGGGIIGSMAVPVSSYAGSFLLFGCKCILYLYEKACQISLGPPGSRIVTGQPPKSSVFCYYMVLVLFCIIIGRYKGMQESETKEAVVLNDSRYRKIIGGTVPAVLMLVLILACQYTYGGPGKLKVTMLDVGQGDGLYIKGPEGINYFVDGGSSDVSSVGKYRIEPFLKSQGVAALDYVFISHGDADHMCGIEELLENQDMGIHVKNLVLPPEDVQDDVLKALAVKADRYRTRVVTMKKGEILREGKMKFTCMAPFPEYSGETGNAASMVLELKYKEFDMLFTGDVEGAGEKLLEKSKELTKYDILKAAHHGSKNSGSEEFLRQTMPKITWISAGQNNRYGHPHEETLKRLKEVESQIYSTQRSGAVNLTTDGKRVEISSHITAAD